MLRVFDDISQYVWYNKYRYGDEKTIQDTYNRVAKAIADDIKEYENFKSIMGTFLPGGRILSNAGTTRKKVILFNCTVIAPPKDSIDGIFDSLKEFALIIRQGGGVGMSLDSLRPQGAYVKGIEGESSGSLSFADLWNTASQTVSSAGLRRAALILIHNYQHPECLDFIQVKSHYHKLTKANLSVGIDEYFMKAIKENKDILQYHWIEVPYSKNKKYINIPDTATPYLILKQDEIKDGLAFKWRGQHYIVKVYNIIKARELWKLIYTHMYKHAEPGLLFLDHINNKNNLHGYEYLHTTNPCITGDTLIAVADGRGAVPIKQLAEEGKDVPVYCIDKKSGEAYISIMRNPRLTREMVDVYEIKFSNGGYLRCTSDHTFYTDGVIPKKAKELTNGTKMLGKHMNRIIIGETLSPNNEVESIKYVGKRDVYNGTVDKFHTYGIIIGNEIVFSANCGEQVLPVGNNHKNGVCCLGSIVLPKCLEYKDNRFSIDMDLLKRAVEYGVDFLSNVNFKSNFVFEGQKQEVLSKRRIGLGVTGVANILEAMGLRYGSKEAVEYLDKLMSFIVRTAYNRSIRNVEKYGEFPALKDIGRKVFAEQCLPAKLGMTDIVDKIKKHGIANSHLLSIAPTGTLSLLAGNVSSGVEPVFRAEYIRNIVVDKDYKYKGITTSGEEYLLTEKEVKNFQKEFDVKEIKEIELEQQKDGTYVYAVITRDYMLDRYDIFDPDKIITAKDVSVDDHIAIMEVMQKYIDSSISKTMVLPEETSPDDVKDLIFKAHEAGLKGITVYVEGSRDAIIKDKKTSKQDMQNTDDINKLKEQIADLEKQIRKSKFKRPIRMKANTWLIELGDHSLLVTVGEVNKQPKEVVVNMGRSGSRENSLCEAIGRLTSAMLQSGQSPQEVSKKLIGIKEGITIWQKLSNKQDKPVIIHSIPDAIAKILLYSYSDNEPQEGEECPSCLLNAVVRQNGCLTCTNCGWSKCE